MRVKLEGFSDLDRGLGELGKATGRAVMRRAGIEALQPMAEDAARRAPKLFGNMSDSIAVSTRRPRRHRKQAEVEVYMGPSQDPAGVQQEFGNKNHPPQPFMRPAWDAGKVKVLDSLKGALGSQIAKSAKRQARRQARLIAKTGG